MNCCGVARGGAWRLFLCSFFFFIYYRNVTSHNFKRPRLWPVDKMAWPGCSALPKTELAGAPNGLQDGCDSSPCVVAEDCARSHSECSVGLGGKGVTLHVMVP